MLRLDRAFHDVDGAVDVISRSADSGLVETPVRSPVFSLRQAHPSPLLSGRPAMGRKLCRNTIAIDLKWVSRDYKDFKKVPIVTEVPDPCTAPTYAWIACCTWG